MKHLCGAFTGLLVVAMIYGGFAWVLAGGVATR